MNKILITAINYPLPMGGKPDFVNGLRPITLKKFTKRNLLPIIASSTMSWKMILELYNLCDGVAFSGGADIDPKYYNQKQHPKADCREKKRDELELKLMKIIIKDKKPFLGFCRGAQILNIAQGGDLHQYIPDFLKDETHGIGDITTGKEDVDLFNNVKVKPGTKLFKILKKKNIRILCNHKQSINKLGKDLIISSESKKGIIEVIEHKDKDFFCFGIQSHPEAEDKSDFEPLFDEFVKAVETYKQKTTQ